MPTPKTIAVTGATGFVGRSVVRELLSRGHRVRAMVRSLEKAAEVLPSTSGGNLDLVVGHALDGRTPADLVKGAHACIHLIGIIREVRGSDSSSGGPQTFQRMHVQATRAVLEACRAAGASAGGGGVRYLHMSALGASPEGKAPYQRTKFEAEVLVRHSGLDWTIFRPTVIHGPDSEFVQMMDGLCSGQEPPWYFIPYFTRDVIDESVPLGPPRAEAAKVQPIAVEAVAWCFAEALEKDITIGEIYNLVGPDVLNWQELTTFFRDTLPGADHKLPVGRIPGAHGVALAKIAGALGLGGLLPFDAGQAQMAMEDSTAELHKVGTHLGLKPRPFKETVMAYAPQLA
jgi:uncharacterized protein YbjT (DUF2867 family)